MEEVSVQVTEPRRRPVRRPGPSQIKMCGFCRLFRAMKIAELTAGSDDKTQRSPAGDRTQVLQIQVPRSNH